MGDPTNIAPRIIQAHKPLHHRIFPGFYRTSCCLVVISLSSEVQQHLSICPPPSPPPPSPSSNIRINPCPTVTTGQVPKKSRPSDPADYRPVALTSHVMKVLERLGLSPAEATVPFNTIQPLLLGEKLQVMGVDDTMISWITDYLTGRPQFVRLGSVLSDVVKFSDDSAVVGCIREGEEGEYRTLVDNFVEWSEQNHLRLNVNKTREMVNRLQEEEDAFTATTDQGGGGGRGGGLQIPGSGDRQQTGLEI
ncbi:hypothetical protein L3Q82_007078 [Scortum barcoo]|uniref:Uncharacterized protein n=1 Tax=Scortum barcoo TaxID=214431 RepID=A0ACB8WS83_9TELE|nr:hypothetical protein L3Q82_007078 [Scortum barcoo]